ncbi:uncharacterized protein BXZ73DRAFT_82334 [Epithele typhae]|uniref:uncharacterized protein n=1 Tax=Epithele typhae TaxID=378194 RepID=UPI0020084AC3|nr:uncharacterized protein BXZ73DRAFT_82334 [Epithele typhae]KAH9912406.1 hypothetical protein BXZ73DRAFT_82334 [Epithele typhae]
MRSACTGSGDVGSRAISSTHCSIEWDRDHSARVADFSMSRKFAIVTADADHTRITYQIWDALSVSIYRGPAFLVANTRIQKFCGTPIYLAPEVAMHGYTIRRKPAERGHPYHHRDPPGAVKAPVRVRPERFIHALLASLPIKRMSLTSALDHPWLVTSAEDKGAPQPLPATPPALHTLPSLPSVADGARAAEPAHAPRLTAPLMGLRRLPGAASLLRMDGEQAAAGPCVSLDDPSLILAVCPPSPERAATPVRDADDGVKDGYVLASPRSAGSEGSQRGRLQRRSEVLWRALQEGEELPASSQDMRAWAAEALGEVGGGPVEEPERHAMKEATPMREIKTLKDDTPAGKAVASPMRQGAKRKSLSEESDDEGEGYAASLPPQTQEREDSEEELPRVMKRPRTELSEMSVADVEGTD